MANQNLREILKNELGGVELTADEVCEIKKIVKDIFKEKSANM